MKKTKPQQPLVQMSEFQQLMKILNQISDFKNLIEDRERIKAHPDRTKGQKDDDENRIRTYKKEIELLEKKLMREATHKFRYIIGHSKVESHPGVLAETDKVSKNIDTRIIKPSQRIAWCNNELKTLR